MHASLVLALAASATAATIDVAIGANGELDFSPDSVTASKGDILRFNWPSSITHNVVSGDFSKPCQSNGLIASPMESSSSMDFFVMINSTDPMFFYCSVGDHCNDGMVMAVNPSSSETLASYKSSAANADIGQPASEPVGGILASPNANPFSGASSGGSASASASASASGSASMSSAAATSASGSMMASMSVTGSTPAMTSEAPSGNSAPGNMAAGVPALVGAAAAGVAMLF